MFSLCTGASEPRPVLVLFGSGRVGSSVITELLKDEKNQVWTTTRSGHKKKELQNKFPNLQVVVCDAAYVIGIENALAKSKAEVLFFTSIKNADEFISGKEIVQACKKRQIRHLVYMSQYDVDYLSKDISSARHKLKIENLIKLPSKTYQCPYTILRPVSIADSLPDSAVPAECGDSGSVISGIQSKDAKVQYTTCKDIGKATACAISDLKTWNGKTIDCVSFVATGVEIAKALSPEGNPAARHTYNQLKPGIFRCCDSEFIAMQKYMESGVNTADIKAFESIIGTLSVVGDLSPKFVK